MYSQRAKLLAVLIAVSAALAALYIAVPTKAGLIAALISAGADLIAVAAMFFGDDTKKLESWADDLAVQVAKAWSHRKDILLGGMAGLTTNFTRDPRFEVATEGIRLGGGDWSNIDDIFLSLPNRKLVILGEAGSGKTLITLQLVTKLLARRAAQAKSEEGVIQLLLRLARMIHSDPADPAQHGTATEGIPVPISVVGWDGSKTLSEWLVSRLRTAYNVRRRRALALVSNGYILPVLDGLDEATATSASLAPLRIIFRLNTDYGVEDKRGVRPLVLTSRTKEYENLPDPEGNPKLHRRLSGAAVVSMQPLTETKIINFLSQQAEASSRRVGELADYLVEGDNSIVIAAMENPLVTALAMRCAMSGIIDYNYLTRLSAKDEVRQYFISSFTSSTSEVFPKSFGRKTNIDAREQSQDLHQESEKHHYQTSSVNRWLYYVAEYLSMQTEASGDLRQAEFSPQDLWRIPETHHRPVRRIHATMAIIVTLIVGCFGAEVTDGWLGAGCWAAATVLAGFFAFRVSRSKTPTPSRVDFRQVVTGRTAAYLIPAVITSGLLAGILAFHISHEISVGITEGVAAAGLAVLLAGLSRGLARAVEPLDGLTNDFWFGLTVGIVGAIAIGFPGGLTGGLWSHLHLNGFLTKPGSQVLAFILALPCGIVLGAGAWLRFQIGALSSRNNFMPASSISFLRWAEVTGLLRAVGASYQFRHEDLREWLSKQAEPSDHPKHRDGS